MSTQPHVTRKIVPENQRLTVTRKIFGNHFPMCLEPTIYNITDNLSENYHGGYWEFYVLSNRGFYMAPTSTQSQSWLGHLMPIRVQVPLWSRSIIAPG